MVGAWPGPFLDVNRTHLADSLGVEHTRLCYRHNQRSGRSNTLRPDMGLRPSSCRHTDGDHWCRKRRIDTHRVGNYAGNYSEIHGWPCALSLHRRCNGRRRRRHDDVRMDYRGIWRTDEHNWHWTYAVRYLPHRCRIEPVV